MRIADTRTEEERKYPQLFRQKLQGPCILQHFDLTWIAYTTDANADVGVEGTTMLLPPHAVTCDLLQHRLSTRQLGESNFGIVKDR